VTLCLQKTLHKKGLAEWLRCRPLVQTQYHRGKEKTAKLSSSEAVPFCILINSEYKFLFLYILTRVFVLL
jgi:hypothetical protein